MTYKSRVVTRRQFLHASGRTAVAMGFPFVIPSALRGAGGRPPAGERLVMAGIGIGNRGIHVLQEFMSFPEVQVVAVCDVQKHNLEAARAEVNRHYGASDCRGYEDYRELLARGDIDLIYCAPPDHWHAQMMVDACKRGRM